MQAIEAQSVRSLILQHGDPDWLGDSSDSGHAAAENSVSAAAEATAYTTAYIDGDVLSAMCSRTV
jgi:hypothetical protein